MTFRGILGLSIASGIALAGALLGIRSSQKDISDISGPREQSDCALCHPEVRALNLKIVGPDFVRQTIQKSFNQKSEKEKKKKVALEKDLHRKIYHDLVR